MFAEHRSLTKIIINDLKKKFVFLCGPRQIGKTTLCKDLIGRIQGKYYLYDDDDDRRLILDKKYLHEKLVCLDEFHKYSRWKNHIKSVYDKHHETLHLLLTGSARLDVYQKSGDSLFGRYYLHHLHPLTVGELQHGKIPAIPSDILDLTEDNSDFSSLIKFGGFPEPFFAQSETELLRWQNLRRQLLIKEDMRDLTQIQLLDLVEKLMLLLPERIGSLFSYTSLAEDIQVGVPTIQNWMAVFERLFLAYKIAPYSTKITRSLKKMPKYFLNDWSEIKDSGSRFENFVASHLYKAAQLWTDLGFANVSLHFIRDRDGREVDFLMCKERKPWFLVECKLCDTRLSNHLMFFANRLGVPGIQLVEQNGIAHQSGNFLVVSAGRWLQTLP